MAGTQRGWLLPPFLFHSQTAFDPTGADIKLLAAILPQITEIAVEFHRVGSSSFFDPADTGVDIIQSEIFATEARLRFLLHGFLILLVT